MSQAVRNRPINKSSGKNKITNQVQGQSRKSKQSSVQERAGSRNTETQERAEAQALNGAPELMGGEVDGEPR